MRKAVEFANALADETRWRILHLVFDEPLCVCELAEILRLPQSTLSSQLKVIQRAGLLAAERRGKWMFYRVQPHHQPVLKSLFAHLASSPLTDATLARDAKKANSCRTRREAACCPAAAAPSLAHTP